MHYPDWRNLPCIYVDSLNSVKMLGEQRPFDINFVDLRAGRPSPMHWHDAFEIGYVLHGTGLLVVEGQEFPFQPGHAYVVNDTYRHMGYAFDHMRLFVVAFHPNLLHDTSFHALDDAALRPFSLGVQRFAPLLPLDHPHSGQIISLLNAIAVEHSAADVGWSLAIKGHLLYITALLLRHFLAPEPPSGVTLRRQELIARLAPALQLLEHRLADPPTLAELAAMVGLHPHYFSMLFQEALGASPVAYRNQRRITLACRWLSESNDPIACIAERTGFDAPQQFNRIFRRLVGCTPSAYRAQLQTSDE